MGPNKNLLMLPLLGLLAIGVQGADSEKPSVQALYWLAGCWSSANAEFGSGEQWMPPAGGTMLGTSRVVSNGKTVAYEFIQIRETGDGGLQFIAKPYGQAEAAFQLLALSEREVIFENPQHDFPQRIIYRLNADGILKARIEGTVDGEPKSVDFPMQKIDCETGKADSQ